MQDHWTSFQNVVPTIPTMQCLKWVLLSWQLPLEPEKASRYFFPPQDFNLNLKIPQQVLLHSDREGDLKCHSFSQSFLVTEDEWLEHGSSPDNTASAFRAAKANRYTVTYLASDSFQPQISKGKNGFFIRFQHSIESIYLNGWVKSSGLKEIVPARHNVLTCDSYACSPRSSFNKYSGQRHPGLMNLHR